jgi:hypothetical protein
LGKEEGQEYGSTGRGVAYFYFINFFFLFYAYLDILTTTIRIIAEDRSWLFKVG